jgi:chaperonin GroEL
MKEKKARVEDALHATRAAVEEGIVPAAASRSSAPSTRSRTLDVENDDQRIGVGIVRRALEEPLRQIANNAGQSRARSSSRR